MSKTDRKLAAQSIRACVKMKTVSPDEARLLQALPFSEARPEDIPVLEQVLASYEERQVWQRGHGDVPLKLRRAIRLLQKDAASSPTNDWTASPKDDTMSS
jgi:hypothetical protein